MRYLYICNTSSDSVSKVNLKDFYEEKKIYLNKQFGNPIGPHSIACYENKLITANNYDNSISIIDTKSEMVQNYFIGMHCNDITVYDNKAYVICGESNNVVVFDLLHHKLLEEIPCGIAPHSIDICKSQKLMLITNMQEDSITLLDCSEGERIKHIKVGAYPTKAIFTPDEKYILVCESNIGVQEVGSICVIELKSLNTIAKIPVGNAPVDLFFNRGRCYVSNFGEGSISIVHIGQGKELKKIEIGGMPRGIIEEEGYIYVGDNYHNVLFRIEKISEKKKVISIGGEPTGMTLI